MVAVSNELELRNLFISDLADMLDEVMNSLLGEQGQEGDLLKIIKKDVYNVYSPKDYQRQKYNGGLLGSWKQSSFSNATISAKEITSSITHDPDMMNIDATSFIHGSHYYDQEDMREYIAKMINDGTSGPMFGYGEWTIPRPFWDDFIELIRSGKIEKLFEKQMRSRGIKFIKVSTGGFTP